MSQILFENHVRKRARLVKDGKFGKFYEKYKNLLDNDVSLEQFVDTIALNYDPTFVSTTATTGSEYIDYIIDNLQRNIISLSDEDARMTKGLLSAYREEVSAKEPRVQKELQRYYRDIVPTLKDIIDSTYAVDESKILDNVDFINFYDSVRYSVAGGLNSKERFLKIIAEDFDPTTEKKYLPYIIKNLVPTLKVPANITLDDAANVKHMLTTHLAAVNENNPKIKRDIARFYPRIFPDLQIAMEAFAPALDFKTNRHANLEINEDKFDKALGKPVFSTDNHLFYYVKDQQHGQKVLATLSSPNYADVKSHCSGFWCLPDQPTYYPAWLTLNRYGYNDYAIVPNTSVGEIKNRRNSPETCITMRDEDYMSILDFMLNADEVTRKEVCKRFSSNISSGTLLYRDYVKFLFRSKDIETVNKLTGSSFANISDFLSWFFALDNITDVNVYKNKAVVAATQLQSQFLAGKYAKNFPMLEPFVGKQPGEIAGTPLDSIDLNKKVLGHMMNKLRNIVKAFVANPELSLTDNVINGTTLTYLTDIIDLYSKGTFQSLKNIEPEKAKKIDEQFASKIDDGTLHFDKAMSLKTLEDAMLNIITFKNTLPASKTYNSLRNSLSLYLKTGGLGEVEAGEVLKYGISNFLSCLGDFIDTKLSPSAALILAKIAANSVIFDMQPVLIGTKLSNTKKMLNDYGVSEKVFDVELMRSIDSAISNQVNYNRDVVIAIWKYLKPVIEASPRKLNELFPNLMKKIAFTIPNTILSRIYSNAVHIPMHYISPDDRMKLFDRIISIPGTTLGDVPTAGTVDSADGTTHDILPYRTGYINVPCSDWKPVIDLLRLAVSDKSIFAADLSFFVGDINKLLDSTKFKITNLVFRPFGGVGGDADSMLRYYRNSKSLRMLIFYIFGKVNGKTIALHPQSSHIYSGPTEQNVSAFISRYKAEKANEDPFAEQIELVRQRAIDMLSEQSFM